MRFDLLIAWSSANASVRDQRCDSPPCAYDGARLLALPDALELLQLSCRAQLTLDEKGALVAREIPRRGA